jgi:hypothetical protein
VVGRLETEAERAERLALYDFPPELRQEIPPGPLITSVPSNEGEGEAHGFDVYLTRLGGDGGKLSGWATYSFSSSEREAYDVRFPSDYDQRHAASLVANVRLSDRWELGTTARLVSGFPRTPALGVRVAAREEVGEAGALRLVPAPDSSGLLIYERDFGDLDNLNSSRQPFFARIDARVTFRPGGERSRWVLYLDMVNVLGRRNGCSSIPSWSGTPERTVLASRKSRSPRYGSCPRWACAFASDGGSSAEIKPSPQC